MDASPSVWAGCRNYTSFSYVWFADRLTELRDFPRKDGTARYDDVWGG